MRDRKHYFERGGLKFEVRCLKPELLIRYFRDLRNAVAFSFERDDVYE